MTFLKEYIKESSLIWVASFDKEGRILSFHSYLPEFSHYQEEEVKNRNWIELLVPLSAQERIRQVFQEIQEKNIPDFSTQVDLVCGEEGTIPCMLNISFLKEIGIFLAMAEKMSLGKYTSGYHKRLETILINVSTLLVSAKANEIDGLINEVLREVGEFVSADRAYVFCASDDRTKVYYAYEWCREGIIPQKERIKELRVEDFPWLRERLEKRQEVVHIPSVNNLPPEANKEKQEFIEEGTKSVLLVPMVLNGIVTGFLGFDAVVQEREWDDDCVFLLKIMGEIVASALVRKQMEFTLEEGRRFIYSIFESIQDGISVLDKDFNIISINPTMEKWYAPNMPVVGKKCFQAYQYRDTPCTICPTQKTLKTHKPAYEVVPKRSLGGEIVGWIDLYSFPLFDSLTGEMKGVIEYVRDATERKKSEDLLNKLAINLRKTNRKLRQLVIKDSHTGLYNHRYLSEVIEQEFQRSRRYGLSLSVIMLDIDYFKSINDVYGHSFGDLVLRQLAGLCKKMVRIYDTVARFGGEEFLFILPDTDHTGALNLARRLLEKINNFKFGNSRQKVHLKVSMGVASYPYDKVSSGRELVELSDKLLTKIKDHGGNNIFWSGLIQREKGRIQNQGDEFKDTKILKDKIEKLTKRANQSIREAIYAFARTIKLKDDYTGEHVERTVTYAVETARVLGLSEEEIEDISDAAMLHDLGKIGISEKILLKRKKLTQREFEEIKKHPQIGADILRSIHFLRKIIPFVLYHHERYDGKGYPFGLKDDEIPLGARIVAIADVYQALISDRPYRKAYTKKTAMRIIKNGAGTQFDPRIVKVFLEVVRKVT